ncbi:FkbM family methyltransferase [Peribacillus butanolivorans]
MDIGAQDGITFSNSYFFEKHKDWKGICAEPLPEVFELLRKNR